jgi:hypothetical protein
VLVPCYKEELNVVSTTVTAALQADMPPGAHRTVGGPGWLAPCQPSPAQRGMQP